MNGQEVKNMILQSGVMLWQVADKWGCSDGNFSRRLRKSFSDDEVKRIESIIAEIKAEQA